MSQPSTIRSQNRRFVLRELLERGSVSRTALAESSRLSRVTVASIVEELLDEGWVVEAVRREGGAGRPAGILRLAPSAGTLAGIDVQEDRVTLALSGLAAAEPRHQAVELERSGDLNRATLGLVRDLASLPPAFGPLRWVTIAVPAPIGPDGRPGEPNSLPSLDLEALASYCAERGIGVSVENDANMAAVAEARWGPARGVDSFGVIAERESGIGLGLYVDGALYRGRRGRAGELGLARWPSGGASARVEDLPPGERGPAIAYLVSGIAEALDLSLLVVQHGRGAPAAPLMRSLGALLPEGISLVASELGDAAPSLGALLCSVQRFTARLLDQPARRTAAP